MKPFDERGTQLDGIFSVEPTSDGAQVILESRGGGVGGPRPPRNADYGTVLELLLKRLGQQGAVLTDIEVYSNVTRKWSPEQRRISAPSFPLPLQLAVLTDRTAFKNQLGRASTELGRREGQKGGNPTKRLRLTVMWPAAVGQSSAVLEHVLAGVAGAILEQPKVPVEAPTADEAELKRRVARAKANMEASMPPSGLPPPPPGSGTPGRVETTAARYVRDPSVIAWVLVAARGMCEVCDEPAPFTRPDGEPFLEVHHLRPLAEGGPDKTDNAAAACPNCHRHLHFGADRDSVRTRVIAKVARLADYPPGGPLVAE